MRCINRVLEVLLEDAINLEVVVLNANEIKIRKTRPSRLGWLPVY